MDLTGVFALIALVCIFGAFYFGAQMVNVLHEKGIHASKLMMRFMIFKYMVEYRRVTLEESGEVDPFHQPCAILLMLTAFFAFLAIVARFLL